MYNKKSIEDIGEGFRGKRVLVRCDFNVPVKDGVITDDKRIVGALPTIKYLIAHGAKVILCSHMGRPHNVLDDKLVLDKKEKKKIDALPESEREAATAAALEKAKGDITKLSLKIVADDLNKKGIPTVLAKDVVGEDAQAKAAALKDGEVLLLENVRFHAAEEKNDPEFAKKLASLADMYVNDAFGTAHRAHASTAGVADYLKTAVCGYLIQKEITVMGKALEDPVRPFVAILGGAKVSDKIGVINSTSSRRCDTIIIGGGMAYTFFEGTWATRSAPPSASPTSSTSHATSWQKHTKRASSFLLPVDNIMRPRVTQEDTTFMRIYSDSIPDGWMGLDIGEKTQELFSKTPRRRRHRHLERPDGRLRMGELRVRYPFGRQGYR